MMRTTLTLDDDVAAEIETIRLRRRVGLKQIINDALRRGLADMNRQPKPAGKAFVTRSFDTGEARLPSLDNVAEVLAVAEGEDFS
jgi:hypothetical protein